MSALGTMHLKAAVMHSRQRRPTAGQDALARIEEAKDLARHLQGQPDPYGLIFDTVNVGVHATSIQIDLGDPGKAVEVGEGLIPDGWAQNRAGHHHMDLARAYERIGRSDDAFQSLATARAAAPTQTRYHPTTRETVLALLRKKRGKPSKPVTSFGRWIGV